MILAPVVGEFRTPGGRQAYMGVRPETSDHNNLFSCTTEDEYRLRDVVLGDGVALDIGAHIGGVTIGLALDNPQAKVIAVECLSENVSLLNENVERNGVSDRVTVLHRAASNGKRKTAKVEWAFSGTESGEHHRFIGNAQNISHAGARSEKVQTVSLAELVKLAGGTVAFMKIDCEGCEYGLLDSPSVKDVAHVRGEHHDGFQRIVALLAATHYVRLTSGTEAFGSFEANLR